MKKSVQGFTLIELLIVIAVMAILGTLGFINYTAFSSSQILNGSISSVQSFLRTAQSNATTSLRFNNNSCKNWMVKFNINQIEGSGTAGTDLSLICQTTGTPSQDLEKERLTLPAFVTVSAISTGSACGSTPFPSYSATILYGALFGKVSLIKARGVSSFECISSANMTVTLRYEKGTTSFTKDIIISTGGSIDVP